MDLPWSWTGVSERHVTYTHGVHHSKNGQRAVDRMAPFDSNQTANFSSTKCILDSYIKHSRHSSNRERAEH